MRKRLKLKKRSCPMCKPHKMGWASRWAAKLQTKLEDAEREMYLAKDTRWRVK